MASTRGVCRVVPLSRGLLAGKGGHRALSSGSVGKDSSPRDSDFEALFADSPPVHSKGSSSASSTHSATESLTEEPKSRTSSNWGFLEELRRSPSSASTGDSTLWKSLTEEPKSSTSSNWGFLEELRRSQPRYSYQRPQTSSSSSYSFRKLGEDSGLEFLKEELDRPANKHSEPAEQRESGVENLLNFPSFKLLRDSFQQPSKETVGIKSMFDDALGLDSSLFSSPDTWTKNVDSRTLAEVEGKFRTTMDQSPAKDIKTYTYEELGEKLRQVRPPVEQMLSSATGLSFSELRTRLQKIEQAENEVSMNNDVSAGYEELKESLSQLKPLPAKKQLSYEELAFVNHVGMRTGFREKLEYTPPKDDLLTKYYSDVQLSSKERLKLEIKKLREEFQTHDCDSGSPQVQIAILTARINNVNRHMREGPNFKRDKHSKKGLSDMVQYRKRLLRYLRRRDWPVYCNVLTKLKLDDVILQKRR